MPRKSYAKPSKRFSRTKRTYTRRNRFRRSAYRTLARRISAVSKRVAGEVEKFESTPDYFKNYLVTFSDNSYTGTLQSPLTTITSGTPWIMPINWIYTAINSAQGTIPNFTQSSIYIDGQQYKATTPITVSIKNPVWYNTFESSDDLHPQPYISDSLESTTQFQYRLKYLYISALFNASISQSQNNTDGALRIVIVKDKQPTGGAATWADSNALDTSRGVFNANRIDAQLNPRTVGRFKIMYDKTLRFNNINGYKSFKYFKRLPTVIRNNRDLVQNIVNNSNTPDSTFQASSTSPPVQKNAFYIMIFSDGLSFTYSSDSSTPAASFHLFNRVAYYNN